MPSHIRIHRIAIHIDFDEIFALKYPDFREINLCICVVDWKFLKSAIKGFLQEVIIRSNIRGTDSRM